MLALGKHIDLVPTTALYWEPPTKINVSLIHSMPEWLFRPTIWVPLWGFQGAPLISCQMRSGFREMVEQQRLCSVDGFRLSKGEIQSGIGVDEAEELPVWSEDGGRSRLRWALWGLKSKTQIHKSKTQIHKSKNRNTQILNKKYTNPN